MQAVSASIEYVLSTTDAAASGPMMGSCTAGNATLPIAAIPGASPISAVLIVGTSADREPVDESQPERTDHSSSPPTFTRRVYELVLVGA
jgi:hypothetical protein